MISQTTLDGGAKWVKLGTVKNIVGHKSLVFTFDFGELKDEHGGLVAKVKELNLVCDSQPCEDQLGVLTQSLAESRTELDELFKPEREFHSRKKRMDTLGNFLKWGTGVMDSEDRDNINAEMENIHYENSRLSMEIDAIQQNLSEPEGNAMTQMDNFMKIELLSKEVRQFSNKIESLIGTATTRKMDITKGAVSNHLMDEKLNEIISKLPDVYELACSKGVLCKWQLEFQAEVSQKTLMLVMQVPLVEKVDLVLNRLVRTPIKLSDSVGVLNLDTNFVILQPTLISPLRIMIIEDLTLCIRRSSDAFLCDLKSDTFEENSNKCLTNIVVNKLIDPELCAIDLYVARLPNRVYIQNDAKQLWFNSETPKTVEMTCGDDEFNITVTGSGFIAPNMSCGVTLTKGEDGSDEVPEAYMEVPVMNREDFKEIIFVGFKGDKFPSSDNESNLKNDQFYDIEQFIKSAIPLSSLIKISAEKDSRLISCVFYIMLTIILMSFLIYLYQEISKAAPKQKISN